MADGLDGHPGVEAALRGQPAQIVDQLLDREQLICSAPHQPLVEVASTSDGGDAARTTKAQVTHDALGIQDQLQLEVVAALRAAHHALVSRSIEMPKSLSILKVAAGLRGKHGYRPPRKM